MFDIVKKAQLHPADLAHWFKAHRVSVSMWLNGRGKPHHLRQERVEYVLRLIESAVAAADLPLSHNTSRLHRRRLVDAILKQHEA